MEYLRQIGTGILIAVISIAIILGGYSLATTEGRLAYQAPANTEIQNGGSPVETQTSMPVTLTPAVTSTDTALPTATSFPTNTPSQNVAYCPPPAGWIAIIVKPLDTLASIANTYQMTQEEIVQGNCLSEYKVEAGNLLYVQPATFAATQIIAPPVACGAPSGWVDYYVVQGDTLYNIGVRYRVKVSDLQKANCLGSSTNITVGQKLKVPYVLATSTPLVPPTGMPATSEPTITTLPTTQEPSPLPPTEVTPPPVEPFTATPVAIPGTPTLPPDPTPG
ncbi:MAG TPA: LysM peptidoglycan-binding domain-containing protein [Anaerolineales bacterium]|jgi:LysM repeat protein